MAKNPAFLFYSSDFLSGVTDLTMEERGQYITLLCLQHQKGKLSEKMIRLAIPEVSPDVLQKFARDEKGFFFNERLLEVIKVQKKQSDHQRSNVKKRWDKYQTDTKPDTESIPNEYQTDTKNIPLESESEYESNDFSFGKSENLLKTDLSAFVLEAAERNQFSHTGERNTEFIKEQWEIFKLERERDPPYKKAQNKDRLGEYFLNWIRNKFPKKQKNGSKVNNGTFANKGKSAGAYQLLDELREEFNGGGK